MTLHARTSAGWEEITPSDFKVNKSGDWKTVFAGHVKVAGQWKKFYQNSSPVTYYFEPVGSNSFRPSGWRGSNDLRVGSYGSPGFGDHAGVLDFSTAVDSAASITYANAIAERPFCSDARITFKRKTGMGFSTTGTGNTWYTGHTSNFGSGTVGLSTTYQRSTTGTAPNGPDTWTGGGQSIFLVNTDLAVLLETNYLYVSNTQTLSSTGGNDDDYSGLEGHLDGTPPVLQITLDYIP